MVRIARGIVAHVKSGYGMPHQNDGIRDLSLEQHLVQLICNVIRIAGRWLLIAPAESRPVIGADTSGL